MKFISTTLVTYNRLDYTKITIGSYLKNTILPHELIVIDNGSQDGTKEYLQDLYKQKLLTAVILNPTNLFPGAATNQGWNLASKDADFLHRSDNDLYYKEGWDTEVEMSFQAFPKMGLLGLINELYQLPKADRKEQENLAIKMAGVKLFPPVNKTGSIGGPCIIKKEIFEKGIKYDERPWDGANKNEDLKFSLEVKGAGYEIYTLLKWKVRHLGFGDIDRNYGYYFETYGSRGMLDWLAFRLWQEKAGKIKDGEVQ